MNLSIGLIFEIIALLFSIFFYIKKRDKLLTYFVPFLLLTVSIEFGGRWLDQQSKFAMYNLFTTFEFCFYGVLFYTYFKKRAFKNFALIFIPFFLTISILNIFFLQGFNKTFNTYSFLSGSFFIVVFCCCFFYESVLPDQIDQQLSKQPFFWICNGLLIFYLGSVIINALFEYLISNDLRKEGLKIYSIINRSLNVVLYSSFCIAFYLCPEKKKTFLSQL